MTEGRLRVVEWSINSRWNLGLMPVYSEDSTSAQINEADGVCACQVGGPPVAGLLTVAMIPCKP